MLRWHPDTDLETVIRSAAIRWADNVDFGEADWIYLADSAIPDLVLQSAEHIQKSGPYRVYRFPVPQP